MGKFGNLFKRKEGGTLVGNLLRGVVNKASHGLLGNGLFMKKKGDPEGVTQEERQNIAKIAQGAVEGGAEGAGQAAVGADKPKAMAGFWEKNKKVVMIAGGVLITILVLIGVMKRKRSGNRR